VACDRGSRSLLAACAVLVDPWLTYVWYQRARKRIVAGAPDAKIRLYRQFVSGQFISVVLFLVYWRIGRIPAASLGLVEPRSWAWTATAIFVIVGALAWSSLRIRPKAEMIRKKVQDGIGALIPDSHQERSWWGAVSLGAGVSEELVYRGFLLYYLSVFLPQINSLERVLLISLAFGLAHIYQGWKGSVAAGIIGLILAGLYLTTGSLILPIVIHAATDSRILLMFPPVPSPTIAAEGCA
jgi:membrane protease YdiL (CAAX protease family)